MKNLWYHITQSTYSEEVLFEPPIPQDTDGEPNVPRICVSSTIEQCLAGFTGMPVGESSLGQIVNFCIEEKRPFVIYQLQGSPIFADEIGDSYRTNEHWFLDPTYGELVGYVSWDDLSELIISETYPDFYEYLLS
jgi:hypothetical protein